MKLHPTISSPADLRKLTLEQLPQLAQEIREAICNQVARSGGHLAPNLGVVELTIALHYVFDFGHDRLLFDVGHQCYPHKLLTGRQHLLSGLRTGAGMAGFPEPRESSYDLFSVGHAGTGISTAVGMAHGDRLNGESFDPATNPDGRRVAVIIGDASIVNGVAMEGLNGAGTLGRQFMVILNDNGMSISKPQGALAGYFDHFRLSHRYTDFKKSAKAWLDSMPGGEALRGAYHRSSEAFKAMISDSGWFEHFGLVTVGPIDGHNLPELVSMLREARQFNRPMVLHVKTVKGKGYTFAEGDSTTFHSPPAFTAIADPDSASIPRLESEGCRVELKREGRSFTSAFGDAMVEMMGRDPRIVACTAAMPDGTGVSKLLAKFPDRSFDTGICESHALDMMAGLAKTGWKPFFAVYSTFLQRAFDQCFQESALQGLPVRLCLDRAGLVGGDGAVHHGFCDVSLLRVLPKAAIMAAIDEPSMKAALEFMRTYDTGLSSCRWPRDMVSDKLAGQACPPFALGKARCLTPDFDIGGRGNNGIGVPDVAVLAFGTPGIEALSAAAALCDTCRVSIYDARFAKPVDSELLRRLIEHRVPIVTVEDHSIVGGFGAAVLEAATDMGLDTSAITRLALPDSWIYQDSRAKQMAQAGIDSAGIVKAIREALEAHGDAAKRSDVQVRLGNVGAKH
jgi:1-deoxy-D-xylulose-5-phosphate synthase